MGTKGGLSEEGCHKFVSIDLMDATSHSTTPAIEPRLPLFELFWSRTNLWRRPIPCPIEVENHMDPPLGLKVNPNVRALLVHQLLKGDVTVGNEDVGSDGRIVKDGDPYDGHILSLTLKDLVPGRGPGLRLRC